MIISVSEEKACNNFQHPLKIISLTKIGIERNFLNLIKNTYQKSTAYITVNGERLNAFPLRSEAIKACPLLPLFKIMLKVLDIHTIYQ